MNDNHIDQHTNSDQPASAGALLSAERQRQGLSREEIARSLHLNERIIRAIEDDDAQALGEASVYTRGYYQNYARLLGVALPKPTASDTSETEADDGDSIAPEPTTWQQPVGRPRWQVRLETYGTQLAYGVVTVLVILAALAFLYPPSAPEDVVGAAGTTTAANDREQDSRRPRTSTASMTPPLAIGNRESKSVDEKSLSQPANDSLPGDPPAAPERAPENESVASSVTDADPAPVSQPAASGGTGTAHTLSITLSGESWAEIVAEDGTRLEYDLLAGAQTHVYQFSQPVNVLLGYAEGASIELDGQTLAVEPFVKADMLRLQIDPTGSSPKLSAGR